MTEGSVIILVASLLLLFQFIDSFTIFKSLLEAGFSKTDSMMLKGVYDPTIDSIRDGRGKQFLNGFFTLATEKSYQKKIG